MRVMSFLWKRLTAKQSVSSTDAAGTTHPHAVLQYFFKGGIPINVEIPSHGNSCCAKPYFRTQPSTIKSIQSSVMKRVFHSYMRVLEEYKVPVLYLKSPGTKCKFIMYVRICVQ